MSHARIAMAVLAISLLGAAFDVGVARAGVEVDLRLVEPAEWEEDPATKETIPPRFLAVVRDAPPGLAEKDFTLKELDTEPPVFTKAEKVATYTEQSADPLALVVLVQGDERWMGNETYLDEDNEDRMVGAWAGVGPAIDALTTAGPPGSQAALLIYHSKVETRLEMGDLSKLTGSVLGNQQAFQGNITSALISGLEEAWALLSKQTGKRRVLVVIGNGEGQTEQMADDIRRMKKKLDEIDAEVFTIQHYVFQREPPIGVANMKELGASGGFRSAPSRENFKSVMDAFVEMIGARYYVTFPGWNDQTQAYFTFDAMEHEYALKVGEEEIEGLILTPGIVWEPPKPDEGGSLWWLWLLLVIALIAIVAIVIIKKRGQVAAVAPPPVMEAPPVAAPQPQKTMMFNMGGGDDGFPVVGWIVPLSGPNQYQTFKLLQGATKVGTGGDAHIVIGDQFMSTIHAEIVCSPNGFTLNDAGSTNGTFVNEKRVSQHELIDNDVFTLGQTDFKFKTIN